VCILLCYCFAIALLLLCYCFAIAFFFFFFLFSPASPHQRPLKCTPGYVAPELERNPKLISPKSDVYSMGVVFAELFMLRRVHGRFDGGPQRSAGEIATLNGFKLKWLSKIVMKMVHPNRNNRPTAAQVVQMLRDGLDRFNAPPATASGNDQAEEQADDNDDDDEYEYQPSFDDEFTGQ
jgi:serine/threonine protein kinase